MLSYAAMRRNFSNRQFFKSTLPPFTIYMHERGKKGGIFLTIRPSIFFSFRGYYLCPILGQQQFSGTNLVACILHGKSIRSQYISNRISASLASLYRRTYMQKDSLSLLLKSIIAIRTLTRFGAPIYC